MNTKIIHIDMDCFYAQVEMRDRPELRKVPLAIGGPPNSRSVLCTCNYLAREYKVRSAMPSSMAVRLCPNLVILRPNFSKYKKESEIIQKIFYKYSTKVETVSLDEAYLDVSDSPNATELGRKIQEEIMAKTGLTASVGVAPNKFLAKIASEWKKPNGFFVIRPSDVEQFVLELPVKLIPGVGKKGNELLESLNIKTCADLQKYPADLLAINFGKFGLSLYEFSRGIDLRKVSSEYERKSLSVEHTFNQDYSNLDELGDYLEDLVGEMEIRLQEEMNSRGPKKIKKFFIKVKFSDFTQSTCEESILPVDYEEIIDQKLLRPSHFTRLFSYILNKNQGPIRLIGVGVRFLTARDCDSEQLSLLPLCA